MTDDEAREEWEERAAIMEYDGGLDRRQAEHAATVLVRRRQVAVRRAK